MRVLMVTGEYPPKQGGVGDYTAHLAKHLQAHDCAVAVATTVQPSEAPALEDTSTWRCIQRWDYGAWRFLAREAVRWGADVINVQYQAAAYGMHPAVNLAPLLLRDRARRPRVVVTFHDLKVPYLFPKAGALRRWAVLLLAATADLAIATNAEDAQVLRSHWLSQRAPSSIVPIGSNIICPPDAGHDRPAFRRRLGAGDGDLLLAYFGFLNERKGIDLLLEALRVLRRRGWRVRLAMIGATAGDSDPTNRAYERHVRALAAAPELSGAVAWTGFVEPAAVSGYLLASDVCVLPFREGASFRHGTLMAAIEHGLAIVSTLPPGFQGREMGRIDDLRPLSDGESALLVPAGDVGALVEAIERIAASPQLAANLRQGAAQLANQFRWPAIAARLAGLYRAVATANCRPPAGRRAR